MIYQEDGNIRHILFFSAKKEIDKDIIYNGLLKLCDIPHCKRIEIQKNRDFGSVSNSKVDFIFYGEFESLDQFKAYKAHPLYQKLRDVVSQLGEVRVTGDFSSSL